MNIQIPDNKLEIFNYKFNDEKDTDNNDLIKSIFISKDNIQLQEELKEKNMYNSFEVISDLESSEELFNYNQPLYQNGKRCGVIFVDTKLISLMTNSGLNSSKEYLKNNKFEAVNNCEGRTNFRLLSKRSNVNYKNDNFKIEYSFLVVKGKTSNIWSFPKGRMQSETENEEDCAIREVYEETGFKLNTIQGLPRIVIGRNVYFIYHTTKDLFKNFTIYDNYEVDEVAWKTMSELSILKCNKDIRAILKYPYRKHSFHDPVFNKQYSPKNFNVVVAY